MMVTFISQCEKKSLKKTRRILDAFADRIGDNVWQTIITEAGLITVKSLLKRSASKNTAVACHWMRSRRRSDLMWIVGNRNQFNDEGKVPVNRTKRNMIQNEKENDWQYLPLIKSIAAIAALLHDWGKSSDLFQKKLKSKKKDKTGDPLRHEFMSCLILKAFIELSGDITSDHAWLECFKQDEWDEKKLIEKVKSFETIHAISFDNLPPIAQMIIWIILSHHRLPSLYEEAGDYSNEKSKDLNDLLSLVNERWGYENQSNKDKVECFKFKQGLLKKAQTWNKQLQRWSHKLQTCLPQVESIFKNGTWRPIIQYSRCALMLGDHYFSSLPQETDEKKVWHTKIKLFANTDIEGQLKQYLDEHLMGVYEHAMQVVHSFKLFKEEMDVAYDIKNLKQISPKRFAWQDKAVQAILKFKKETHAKIQDQGWFIVNMASTGTGKTIANAKIMQALSLNNNELRYILALGLRTLTLQTGDAYKYELGMSDDDLAVLIGSSAIQSLHEQEKLIIHKEQDEKLTYDEIGSESLESLMENDLIYEKQESFEFFQRIFPEDKKKTKRNQAFLQKPVLVCTIDHLMGATETTRGGRYILPYLRLLSSDIVIDEVDDFNVEDFLALSRLVHLVGMCGRKVMLSSATIPPALAKGLFNVYKQGFDLFCAFHNKPLQNINTMWVDEFSSEIKSAENYTTEHEKFVNKRKDQLLKQVIKQRAQIIRCDHLMNQNNLSEKPTYDQKLNQSYFELIQNTIVKLHHDHHTVDLKTGKKVSFGVVRVANIPPCIELTRFLLNTDWDNDIAPKVMAYHSRQVLLLRNEQEKHLDSILKRKEKEDEQPAAFNNKIIRNYLDHSSENNLIFILVATPVEEVGRDHDFDWAVIEPSSYRSIIQLSGRVLRHRQLDNSIEKPNIAIMQYNLKGLNHHPVAFNRPGFEIKNEQFKLKTKDILSLLDHENEILNINAIPRILESKTFKTTLKEKDPPNSLSDLEHKRITTTLLNENTGPKYVNGWINEAWFLTALPQYLNPFRKSAPTIALFYVYKKNKDKNFIFCERNKAGEFIEVELIHNINPTELTAIEMSRLWFKRDYFKLLEKIISLSENEEDFDYKMERASKRYGEIMISVFHDKDKQPPKYFYSDQFGIFTTYIPVRSAT